METTAFDVVGSFVFCCESDEIAVEAEELSPDDYWYTKERLGLSRAFVNPAGEVRAFDEGYFSDTLDDASANCAMKGSRLAAFWDGIRRICVLSASSRFSCVGLSE